MLNEGREPGGQPDQFGAEHKAMSQNDELADLRQRAAAAGLTSLTNAHLLQLQRAAARSRGLKSSLTIELSIADEPAHVFSLVEKG